MKGLLQIVVVDVVDRVCQNSQPLVIGNIFITQGHRPEDARLFDQDLGRIFFAVDIDVFRSKDMPVVATNETDQLYNSQYLRCGAVGCI